MGMHMCMDCNRGIHLSLFRFSHLMDPTGVKQPPWLATALRQPGPDQARDIVADSEVERLRLSTIARSLIEDHRKVAFFGGVVIKAVDHGLSNEVKPKFRANVRGPMIWYFH